MAPAPRARTSVVIVGAGGHAKVVIELLREAGMSLVGLTDADATPRHVLGVPVLGGDELLPSLLADGVPCAFVALGDNALRLERGRRLEALGFVLVNAISSRAAISPSARLGCGIAVMAGATINAEAQVGDFAIVNTNASIDHETILADAAHVGPGAALAGKVRIGREAMLGIGSSVAPGCSIGEGAIVGAGACVISDIPANVVAMGVPATVTRSRTASEG